MPEPSENNAPTALEQAFLEYINRARLDPQGEYAALIADGPSQTGTTEQITTALRFFGVDAAAFQNQLSGLDPLQPLAWSPTLALAAQAHNAEMIAADIQSHQLPGEARLAERIVEAGYPETWLTVGEAVWGYGADTDYDHAVLFIDWGYDREDFGDAGMLNADWQSTGDGIQDPPGHRNAILSADKTEVGISVVIDPDSSTDLGPHVITQNFATRSDYQSQLLGVVIADGDDDAFYDVGEGLGGVTVSVTGSAADEAGLTDPVTTQSWTSGGYQIALQPGTYTVTFSGGDLLAPLQREITMGPQNLKLDVLAHRLVPGTEAEDTLAGFVSDDILQAGAGDDLAYAGAGNDLLQGDTGADTLYGGGGHDTLMGGAGNDLLGGGAGADSLEGGEGDDAIWTAQGNDTAHGGDGADTLGGAAGDDSLLGGAGDDALWGALDHDTLMGGTGADTLGGSFGDDSLQGGDGADELWGAAGRDTLEGGTGDDQIGAGLDDDLAFGGVGHDTVSGGLGHDTLLGEAGDDVIFAAAGDDVIVGGAGNDTLYGGAGADIFLFTLGDGADRAIVAADEDLLQLDAALWGESLSESQVITRFGALSGPDYVLTFGADSLTLVGQANLSQRQLMDLIEIP